jgi:DNA-binding MarR family transcriptional regulator
MQEAERHGLSLSSAKRLLKKAVDLEFIVKQEDNYKKRK